VIAPPPPLLLLLLLLLLLTFMRSYGWIQLSTSDG
jgi:hypothetical protein